MRLEANLCGLRMTQVRDASLGYMDDVHVLGSHLSDIHLAFEAAAGAILNRNKMSLILDLGSWDLVTRIGLHLGCWRPLLSKCWASISGRSSQPLCFLPGQKSWTASSPSLGWQETAHPPPESSSLRGLCSLQDLCPGQFPF